MSIEVTKTSDTEIEVTETKTIVEVRIESVDSIVRQIAERYAQKEKEMADRDAEIAVLNSKLSMAKDAGVEPSAAVADIAADNALKEVDPIK